VANDEHSHTELQEQKLFPLICVCARAFRSKNFIAGYTGAAFICFLNLAILGNYSR
jgi:hypothetical protein